MADISYGDDLPEEIEQAEQEAQEIAQGRLIGTQWLAYLTRVNFLPAMSVDDLNMVCRAAIHSGNLERIADLEKQVQEHLGTIEGLKFQLSNRPVSGDVEACLEVIRMLRQNEHKQPEVQDMRRPDGL